MKLIVQTWDLDGVFLSQDLRCRPLKTCTNLKKKTHVYNTIEKCAVKSRFEFIHDEKLDTALQ